MLIAGEMLEFRPCGCKPEGEIERTGGVAGSRHHAQRCHIFAQAHPYVFGKSTVEQLRETREAERAVIEAAMAWASAENTPWWRSAYSEYANLREACARLAALRRGKA